MLLGDRTGVVGSEETGTRVSDPEPVVAMSLGVSGSLSELPSMIDLLSNIEDGLVGIPEVRGRTEARLLRGKDASPREG